MKPQSCKAKGRRHQQKIAKDILDAFPNLQPDDVVSTSMGCPGVDIRLSTAAKQQIPLAIEAKNQEKMNIWAYLQQCEANTPEGEVPCVVFTRNHANTYAVVPWEVLLDLYKRIATTGSELPPRLTQLMREIATFVPSDTESQE